MKKYVLSIVLGLMSLASFAQQTPYPGVIDFTIRWNTALNRYEVYARPTVTRVDDPNTPAYEGFTWGPSTAVVVAPASTPDVAFSNLTSYNGGGWGEPNQLFAPAASPTNDFHFILSQGQQTNLVANQELLLYSFTLPSGVCIPGLRMFRNNAGSLVPDPNPDPTSSAAGMQGADYNNTVDNGFFTDVYRTNYNNTGTTCTTCSVTAPELIKR